MTYILHTVPSVADFLSGIEIYHYMLLNFKDSDERLMMFCGAFFCKYAILFSWSSKYSFIV
jgi:hypothetical protein